MSCLQVPESGILIDIVDGVANPVFTFVAISGFREEEFRDVSKKDMCSPFPQAHR